MPVVHGTTQRKLSRSTCTPRAWDSAAASCTAPTSSLPALSQQQVELLQKLLKGELASRRRKNVVQARSFAEMLEQTLRRYQNRAIEAAGELEAAAATLRRDGVALASRKGFSELAGDMEAALKSIRLVLDDAKVDRELRDRDPNGPDLGGGE